MWFSKLSRRFGEHSAMQTTLSQPTRSSNIHAGTDVEASCGTPDHEYKPLSDINSTRLLVLYPGTTVSDPLVGHLLPVLLYPENRSRPSYHALLYAWGDPKIVEPFKLGIDTLLITRNLACALRRIRDCHGTRIIWADGICINQSDLEERNKQVRIMGDVYRMATRVLVWLSLDPLGETLQVAVPILQKIQKPTMMGPHSFFPFGGFQEMVLQLALKDAHGYHHDAVVPLPQLLEPIKKLFERQWLFRRWVIQEAVIAKEVTFLGNGCEIDWDILQEKVLSIGESTECEDYLRTDIFQALRTMQGLRKYISAQSTCKTFGILGLLVQFHRAECSDDRDRIYALSALTQVRMENRGDLAYSPLTIEISYHLTPQEVYVNFAKWYLSTQGSLNILQCAGAFRSARDSRLQLPSWVPNWRAPRRYTPLLSASRFKAWDPDSNNNAIICQEGHLQLRGVLVDIIVARTPKIHCERPSAMFPVAKDLVAVGPPTGPSANARYASVDLRLEATKTIARKLRSDVKLIIDSANLLHDGEELEYVIESTLIADHALARKKPWNSIGDETEDQNRREFRNNLFDSYLLLMGGYETLKTKPRSPKLGNPLNEMQIMDRIRIPFEYQYADVLDSTMPGRCCFYTRMGYLGIASDDIVVGDMVIVFHGSRTPHVLRATNSDLNGTLISEAYVHGLMNGEVISLAERHERTFILE